MQQSHVQSKETAAADPSPKDLSTWSPIMGNVVSDLEDGRSESMLKI